MIPVRDFWRRIDSATLDGVLVLVLFRTWKRIADNVGFDGVDIASGFFDTLCGWATEGALAQSRLATTVFGAYWTASAGGAEKARERLTAWLPLGVSSRGVDLELDCEVVFITHPRTDRGADLYRRASATLQALVDAMPAEERYPALQGNWGDVTGR
jgi:hypothetical protein